MTSQPSIAIVKVSIILFNVFGTFGNVNIIVATFRNKELQHRCGILLCIMAVNDLICLWHEIQSFFRLLYGLFETPLSSCFYANILYIFCEPVRVYIFFVVGLDRIFAISFPVRYRQWNTKFYLAIMISPGVISGLLCCVLSFIYLTDEIVEICVLPLAMPKNISQVWNKYNIVMAGLTAFIYILTYIRLYIFNPFRDDKQKSRKHKLILSTLIVQVIFFIFSSALSASIILSVRTFYPKKAIAADFLAVIPGLLSYSCNYYIYFWRSKECRRIFLKQLICGYTLKKIETNQVSGTTVIKIKGGLK